MPQEYRFLNHRSDLFIQGTSDTQAGAIEAVAYGLFASICGETQKDCITVQFEESGVDFQDLVVNIFTRILAEMDINSRIGAGLQVVSLEGNRAKLKLRLCKGRAKMHVKAVTYHEFQMVEENGKHKLRVLFDI
ncbi:MAG: archease [Candidatus Micrarchaeota archaeon]|nr:archease [Candidatus Micrarchaeota archaeon]